jgi:diguanylate cyclase (GGDEF)-like protein/PAS domain S-box-containing protein
MTDYPVRQGREHRFEFPIAEDSARTLLTEIIESAPMGMILIDHERRIVLVNREVEALSGHARGDLLGEPVERLVPESSRCAHDTFMRAYFKTPSARQMGVGRDLRALRKDGTSVPVEIALKPLDTSRGMFVLAVIVDVSERKRLERRFELAVESAPIAMLMVDQHGQIVLANRECEKLYGYARAELLGQPVEVLVPADLRAHDSITRERFFAAPIARRMGAGQEFRGKRKDGSEMPIEIGLNPVQTEDGQCVLVTIMDISERKRLETAVRSASDELERRVAQRTAELALANHKNEALLASLQAQRLELERLSREDPLTGLANRRDFDNRLREEIQRAQRYGTPLAVAMFDLDHFKLVNDRFGHALGDAVLRETAGLLHHACRAVDVVARYGGEEFTLAMPDSDLASAFIVCERIRHAFEHFDWSRLVPDLHVTLSAGISVWTEGIDAERLLAQADANLYEAKHSGRNRVIPAVGEAA